VPTDDPVPESLDLPPQPVAATARTDNSIAVQQRRLVEPSRRDFDMCGP